MNIKERLGSSLRLGFTFAFFAGIWFTYEAIKTGTDWFSAIFYFAIMFGGAILPCSVVVALVKTIFSGVLCLFDLIANKKVSVSGLKAGAVYSSATQTIEDKKTSIKDTLDL